MRIRNQIAAAFASLVLSTALISSAASASFGSGPVFIGELPLESFIAPENTGLFYAESDITMDNALISAFNSLPRQASLPMHYISQYPELPTGCESVSLTMALNSLGFTVQKTEIAQNYLVYADDIAQGYNGDPFAEDGAGVFPPGLVMTANSYLKAQNSSIHAYETSGTSFNHLLAYLACGNPVCLWVTMEYDEPWWGEDYGEFEGTYYEWYWNEHCVALGGYDLDAGTVSVYDPLNGYFEMDLEDLRELSEEIGNLSLVLR